MPLSVLFIHAPSAAFAEGPILGSANIAARRIGGVGRVAPPTPLYQLLAIAFHQIRRRHFIRATKERLRKRDRPLVPRSRNPLCVCPWGIQRGGTPFGAPSAMCQIDSSKGRTRGTPKEWVPFLCLCASRFFYYPTTWGSTYKSAGGTLSGTTKERLRKQA